MPGRRSIWIIWLLCTILSACAPASTVGEKATPAVQVTTASTPADLYTQRRLAMVDETIVARGISDPEVLRAMRTVPRHRFVPDLYLDAAYNDTALAIGYGQTISQPYVVAWMTELLALEPGEKVLEIGTGSGYQAAVLAELGVDVYSIEIIPTLAEEVKERLQELGYDQIHLQQGDGYYGWEEHAPFDAIIVTAAPDHLPAPLVAQLCTGGRLVIPIGPPGNWQQLWRFVKTTEGDVRAEELGWVIFVPLTGAAREDHRPQNEHP